jgi:hypothetical protein
MKKAFDEGWGGVIVKTLSLEAKKVCECWGGGGLKQGALRVWVCYLGVGDRIMLFEPGL